jgi:opacity protein-like surface antigen
MKKICVALSVLAASIVSASAADLPVKAKPIVAAGLDWSGVYAGAHAGYGGGMMDWESIQPGAAFVARGMLAGGQIGINKQLGSLVFGLELDGSWADLKGTGNTFAGGPALGGGSAESRSTSRTDGLVTLAGRAGIAADRWFVFAKGGLSAAHQKHDWAARVTTIINGVVVIQTGTLSGSETRYAPMLGFGAEYALLGPWSVLAEYNYHHFGAATARLTGTPISSNNRVDEAIHIARLGVNYRFGNLAPDPSFAPVPPASGTNWTGAYIGAQGGYGWGQTQWPDVLGFVPANTQPRFDSANWLAGGTVGVNAQSGRFVFGVEGEILATGIKDSFSWLRVIGPTSLSVAYASKIDWLALATARAGFVVGDAWMFYGKGGIAIAQEQHTAVAGQHFNGITTAFNHAGSAIHTGAVVGVGAEYAFAPNWSVKAEYDYVRMFAQRVQFSGIATGGPFGAGSQLNETASKINQDLHLVKFGVNYHFNPQPLIAARY